MGGIEKRVRKTKILERMRGKLGQGMGAFKRGRLESPYELWYVGALVAWVK